MKKTTFHSTLIAALTAAVVLITKAIGNFSSVLGGVIKVAVVVVHNDEIILQLFFS